MYPLRCCFCDHGNPDGAKFCNNCGSPLQLKPCPVCDAINELSAERCHHCNSEFAAGTTVTEGDPAASSTRVSDTPGDARPEPRARTLPELVSASLEHQRRRPVSASAEVARDEEELFTLDWHAAALAFPDTDQSGPAPELPPRERSWTRLIRAASVAVLLVVATVLAVNYLHRGGPVQLQGWLGAKQMDSGPSEDARAENEAIRSVSAETPAPESALPLVDSDRAVIPANDSMAPAPMDRPGEVAGASVEATAAPAPSAEADLVAPKRTMTAAKRPGPKTAAASKRGARHVAATRPRSSAPPQFASPLPPALAPSPVLAVPPAPAPPRACEDTVAALGLCNPNPR